MSDDPAQAQLAAADAALYGSLVRHRVAQETLMWGRVQSFMLVQLAALPGAWALAGRMPGWAALALIFVAFLDAVLLALFWKDQQDCRKNQGLMDELAGRLQRSLKFTSPVPRWTSDKRICLTSEVLLGGKARQTEEEPGTGVGGADLIPWVVLLFIVLDMSLAVLMLLAPCLFR